MRCNSASRLQSYRMVDMSRHRESMRWGRCGMRKITERNHPRW